MGKAKRKKPQTAQQKASMDMLSAIAASTAACKRVGKRNAELQAELKKHEPRKRVVADLEQRVYDLKKDNDFWRGRRSGFEKEISAKNISIANLEKEIEARTARVVRYREEVINRDHVIGGLNTQIKNRNTNISDLEERIKSLGYECILNDWRTDEPPKDRVFLTVIDWKLAVAHYRGRQGIPWSLCTVKGAKEYWLTKVAIWKEIEG